MLKFSVTCCRHYFSKNYGYSKQSESIDLPLEVDQRIHNLDSDSSHNTSEFVDLMNLDSTEYGCEINLLIILISEHKALNLHIYE